MCGISGIWTSDGAHADELRTIASRMNRQQAHRGPDDSGIWIEAADGIALGHQRLSVVDLSSVARQPMAGPSDLTRIVFNGEIYNYRELRASLLDEGVVFRSRSDSEVILALYEKHGVDCLRFLRGMFAFAIWDARNKRLFLARDRIGKKPLYCMTLPGRFLFASEIRALRGAGEIPLSIDPAAVDRYLSDGFIGGPRTIYRAIAQLPPATYLVATAPDQRTISRYWAPVWPAPRRITPSEAVNEAEKHLSEAVRLRLHADVPVGIFLSGGIDSGLVTAFANRQSGPGIPTFTVGFEDREYDERLPASLVARQYGADHHESLGQVDVAGLIPSIVQAYGQPFADPSAVPSFCVARYARECGFKVMLTGDGGDELFGGYRRNVAAAILSRAARVLGADRIVGFSRLLEKLLPLPRAHRTPYALAHRFIRGAAGAGTDDLFRIWSGDGLSRAEKDALGFAGQPADRDGPEAALPGGNRTTICERMMALDLNWTLPYAYLVKLDIASMAHGVEARSPWLDQELVEWALSLPNDVRYQGFRTKPLLRSLAQRYLPPEICTAPKRGFEPPVFRWLTGDLQSMRDDVLLDSGGFLAQVFDRRRLENFLCKPPAGDPERWARHVWTLFMLAAWDCFY